MATKRNKQYDVAVIGAGPAGMMASGRAGELGARVVLIEKNVNLGLKLLMTGNGRCNITNKIDDVRKLVEKYGLNGKFLFSAFNKFGVEELIEFFENRGVETKIEPGNRILPVSNKAQDVLDALIGYLKDSNVEVKTNSEVKEIIQHKSRIEKVILMTGEEIIADKKNVIIIEWADRIAEIIPKDALWAGFEWIDEKKRKIILNSKFKI